jgi:3-hydroxyethyl bacteriochlorophyllide a dehydrogenase
MEARAVVLVEPHKVELRTHELVEPRDDELVVRTEYSGVSQGTEMDALRGRRPELSFPTVTGYQSVGRVERVGPAARGFETGQRVLFTSSRLPRSFPFTWMGGHVSHAVVAARAALPVPEPVDPVEAALASLVGVALGGISQIEIPLAGVVVVNGQGMIGQCAAQLARLRGAIVLASEPGPRRRELSQAASADQALAPDALPARLRELAPRGADVVIETTGRADQLARCVEWLRPEGRILLQGYYKDPVSFEFHATHLKKPTLAIACGIGDLRASLALLAWRKLRLRELVTHLAEPSDAPDLFARMERGDPDVLGVVFRW